MNRRIGQPSNSTMPAAFAVCQSRNHPGVTVTRPANKTRCPLCTSEALLREVAAFGRKHPIMLLGAIGGAFVGAVLVSGYFGAKSKEADAALALDGG